MTGKYLRKISDLHILYAKKEKIYHMFQNILQIVKKKLFF